MEMDPIYRILGDSNRHILASNLSHLNDICEEIQRFIDADRLEKLFFDSYAPGRLRGIPQILRELYRRFQAVVPESERNNETVKQFEKNLGELALLADGLEKSVNKTGYNWRDSEDLIAYTNALAAFFQREGFLVEDVRS